MDMKHLEQMIAIVCQRIKEREGLQEAPSYYYLSNKLRDLGVKITQNGMLSYRGDKAKSMRWDVMAGLQKLGGLTDREVMEFVRRTLPKGGK